MLLESLLSFHGELKVSTLAKSGQEFSTIRPRPEVMQAIRNLGALEIAIVALLEKDGHPAPKDELRRTADRQAMIAFGLPAPYVAALSGAGLSPPSRHSNIVLPDPIDWDRIRESERRLKVELQLQYNTLLEIVSTVQPKGNWMYVLADLTRPVDADRLLISSVPDLVLRHPETTVENIPADLIQKVRDAITQTRDSVDRRRSVALQSGLVSLAARLGPIIDNIGRALIIVELAERLNQLIEAAKEEARKFEEQRLNKAILDSRPIREWQNHVDSFDRNREWIERTC